MRLIGLAVFLAVTLLTPLGPAAQQVARISRIGVFYPESARCAGVFRQGLIDLGYVEGRTIAFEYRSGGSLEQHVEQAQDLARRQVDLLVAPNSWATRAAKEATRTIPIVTFSADAVESGFVASLARPGGNITGISIPLHELMGKRLEIVRAAVPAADRIAVFVAPSPRPGAAKRFHENRGRVRETLPSPGVTHVPGLFCYLSPRPLSL